MVKYFVENCFVFLLHRPLQLGEIYYYITSDSSQVERSKEKEQIIFRSTQIYSAFPFFGQHLQFTQSMK